MSCNSLVALSLALLLVSAACGGDSPPAPAVDSGAALLDSGLPLADAGRPAPDPTLCADIQTALDAFVSGGLAPGVVATAILPDRSMCSAAAGLADVPGAVPFGPTDRFRIGSVTKTFAAVVVLLLAERGSLSLSDPISRWVTGVPNGDTITLVHLLTHTSGLDDYAFTPAIEARLDQPHTPAELLAIANALTPRGPPGSPFEYSNTNFMLIGLASEAAGGAPWATLVRDLLLDPLGLTNTYVFGYEPVPGGFVQGYVGAPGAWVDASTDMHPTVAYAAGCMVSNGPDLARWFEALFSGRVLAPASLVAMTDDHRVSTGFPNEFAGLGLFLGDDMTGARLYKHSGGLPGYSTNVERADPVGTVLALEFNTSRSPSATLRSLRRALWTLLPVM